MKKKLLFVAFGLCTFLSIAQIKNTTFKSKLFLVKNDSIKLDSVPIFPSNFNVFDAKKVKIDSANYVINFNEALLIINSKKYDTILVTYYRIPDFLTKKYSFLDEKLILNSQNNGNLYSINPTKTNKRFDLFEGLQTRGFITRGLTSGNNQNAVTNSSLDLEIEGKLSENVSIKAHIFDTNIPIQENGYSQNFTDFDRIFMEIYSKNWGVRAGDISLEENSSFFVPFTKQISGLRVKASITDDWNVLASGAVVRGKFNNFRFVGVEGNQGPYKLFGQNNEPAILIIEGSDRVFVNGVPLNRGESKDYIINYNLGEITFNTTFPINNDMRITVEFQYADRNYTRFITYNKSEYQTEKVKFSGFFYSENDAKNQPIQQNLSDAQKQILANAGNNINAMIAESAFEDTFDPNKILYQKVTVGNDTYFEYTTENNTTLYTVNFTNVGQNRGNYALESTTALGSIFKFVGVNLGNYNPIIRLTAPTKSQFAVFEGDVSPTDKTKIETEIALSVNDANLFSTIDDEQNKGLAAKIAIQQQLMDKKWKLFANISHEYAHKNFRTLQRWESIEFNRDWNILTNNGTKNYLQTELNLEKNEREYLTYKFDVLKYDGIFSGNKHQLESKLQFDKTQFFVNGNLLQNTSTFEDNQFYRFTTKIERQFTNFWLGFFANTEKNARKTIGTSTFINTSHRYKEAELYLGLGDTTKVFTKVGFNFRDNDSIKNNVFTKINDRKTIYIKSKLLQNKQTNLSVFANYRFTNNTFTQNEQSLNSKINYQQKLANNFINLNTVYETSSNNVARQEFIYVKTEPGLGFYTWIDYNGDGIKDLNEFEVAQFQDQAEYLRLPRPNLSFLPTQRVKLQQSVFVSFKNWSTSQGFKKTLSHFDNQTFMLASNEKERNFDSFQLNPFDFDENNLVSLQLNFRNTLYYNRGLNNYSTSYTFGDAKSKQQFFIGTQQNDIKIHQLDFAHKLNVYWLLEVLTKTTNNILNTPDFTNRNYEISSYEAQPKLSFMYSENHKLSTFYHFSNKQNKILNQEYLEQHKLGLEYYFNNEKNNQITANFTYFKNNFEGNTNSPVAYQMLEGLQNGNNITWNFIFHKKINNFLNLNLSYFGRKSQNVRAIHSGNVQLRADF